MSDYDRTHTILPNGRCQQHPKGCILTPDAFPDKPVSERASEPDYCHCGRRDDLDTAVCFGAGFGCPYCGRQIDPQEDDDE